MRSFRASGIVVIAAATVFATAAVATAGRRCRCQPWPPCTCVQQSTPGSAPAAGVPTLAPARPSTGTPAEAQSLRQQHSSTVYVSVEVKSEGATTRLRPVPGLSSSVAASVGSALLDKPAVAPNGSPGH